MVYTHRSPALFVIGLIMLGLWYAAGTGHLDPLIAHLKIEKIAGELKSLPLYFGAVSAVLGLWHWLGRHRAGPFDYYSSAVAGGMFILLIAMLVRWFLDPWIALLSTTMGKVGSTDKYIHDLLGLNYIVLGILAGVIIVNVFSVPKFAQNGVRLARLGLKTGVILLGTLYSLAELTELGKLSVVMIGVFVLGSVGVVLWFARMRGLSNSMSGVLSAGVGVCGVSAAVAVAPVVQAKSLDIAYTIGTVLLWGVGCMFVFPVIGNLLNMSHVQFGAWAGTGILNSAQVAGAALAYQPDGIETLKVAEIFNITRVLFLPVIVLWLALWYVRKEQLALHELKVGYVIVTRFPVFVLGFILMFALSSTGVFAPAHHYQGKYFDNDIAADKLLTDEQKQLLLGEITRLQREDQKAAMMRLTENGKLMSADDDDTLRGAVNAKLFSEDANKLLGSAHKAVRQTAKKIEMFRHWITWLFAFGLVGLGMQITVGAMKQAGGQPAIIGGIVGFLKAALSLVVVLAFVKDTV